MRAPGWLRPVALPPHPTGAPPAATSHHHPAASTRQITPVSSQAKVHPPNPSCTSLIIFIYYFSFFDLCVDFICLFMDFYSFIFSSGAGERGGLHVEFFLDCDAVMQQRPRLRAPDQRRSRPLPQPDHHLPHQCRLHMVSAAAKAHAPSRHMA